MKTLIFLMLIFSMNQPCEFLAGEKYYVKSCSDIQTPWEECVKLTLVVVECKDGWIKYCHDEDYKGKKTKNYFTKPQYEFKHMVDSCRLN